MQTQRLLTAVLALSVAAGCAGKQSNTSFIPAETPALTRQGGASATIQIPPVGASGRLPPAIPKEIYVEGYLYGGYAGTRHVSSKGSIPTVKAGTSVSMRFRGAYVANNEWAYFNVYAKAADGKRYIGSEATYVNVTGTAPVTVRADAASTLLFQAMDCLLSRGLFDAEDMKDPGLASTIAKTLAKSNIKPDKSTGLYSKASLQQFLNEAAPRRQRTITIEPDPSAEIVSVANDPSSRPDTNLYANPHGFFDDAPEDGTGAAGQPCYTGPANRPAVCAQTYAPGAGSVTLPVYGGPLVVGASNDVPPYAAPFRGVTQRVAARTPGNAAVTLGAMRSTQTTITADDPADWAFGQTSYVLTTQTPARKTQVLLNSAFTGGFNARDGAVRFQFPSNFSAANPTIAVDTWNPWKIPISNFAVCYQLDACRKLPIAGVFSMTPTFYDNGSNLAYYNWTGSGGTSVATAATRGCGYTISPSGSTATFSTHTRTLLERAATLVFSFEIPVGFCGPVVTSPSTMIVTAIDSNGASWSGTVIGNPIGSEYTANYEILFNIVPPLVTVDSITVSIGLSGTPAQLDLISIANNGSY